VIIGLGHVAQVGKDTAAEGLIRDLGFQRHKFAAKLLELAMFADPIVSGIAGPQPANVNVGHGRFAWTVKGMGYDEAKSAYPEVRRFLQTLGEGGRKVFGEDFWVDAAFAALPANRDVVFTDVRYRNEAEAIQAAGGYVIKVNRPGRVGSGHVSETDLADFDGWDAVVDNSGSIEQLQGEIVRLAREWMRNAD
jgi:hypothetical protein